jgi:uncharacterized protein (TIGR00251 family)
VPNASKNSIAQIDEFSYRVRLTTSPVDGKANQHLIRLLAQHFKVAQSAIVIKRGLSGKKKLVLLQG